MQYFVYNTLLSIFALRIILLKILYNMKKIFNILVVALTLLGTTHVMASEPHIIPQPAYIDMAAEGTYTITAETKIVVYDDAWDAAEVFAQDMQQYFGSKRPLRCAKRGNGIKVRTDNNIQAANRTNSNSAGGDGWFKIDNFRLYKTIDEDFVPTAINTVSTATKVVGTELYDLSGRRIQQYQKGVNIVRHTLSDGTIAVKKVMVK